MWYVGTCGAHPIGSHRDYQVCALHVRHLYTRGRFDSRGHASVHFSASVSKKQIVMFAGESVRCNASKWSQRRDGKRRFLLAIAETEGKVNRYRTDHKYLGMALHTCNGLCWTGNTACSRCVPFPEYEANHEQLVQPVVTMLLLMGYLVSRLFQTNQTSYLRISSMLRRM